MIVLSKKDRGLSAMSRRLLALFLCVVLFALVIPAAAFAEEDYDTVTIQKGDTVLKLLKARGRSYETDKYIVMVLNRLDRESKLEILSIGDTLKIPKASTEIIGRAPHLISSLDTIDYYVIPYKIQKGDTIKFIYKLWGLPYDSYADRIAALNPGVDLDKLYVGDLVLLPTTEKNLKTNVYTTVMSHTLLQDESVESVFERYGIDFTKNRDELQKYNAKAFDKLGAGEKLLIPLIWN